MIISLGKELTLKERFCIREDGAPIVRCAVSYTEFEGAEKYNALYAKISSNCSRWAREVLAKRARAEYLADPDEEKRFHFRCYEYSFSSYVSGENDEVLCVINDACLSRRGEGRRIELCRSSQLWRRRDLALLPDVYVLPKSKRRYFAKLRATGIFLRGAVIYAFGGGASDYWEERLN